LIQQVTAATAMLAAAATSAEQRSCGGLRQRYSATRSKARQQQVYNYFASRCV
jgi:hypothetical protein